MDSQTVPVLLTVPVLSEKVNYVKRCSIHQSDCKMQGCLPLFLQEQNKTKTKNKAFA